MKGLLSPSDCIRISLLVEQDEDGVRRIPQVALCRSPRHNCRLVCVYNSPYTLPEWSSWSGRYRSQPTFSKNNSMYWAAPEVSGGSLLFHDSDGHDLSRELVLQLPDMLPNLRTALHNSVVMIRKSGESHAATVFKRRLNHRLSSACVGRIGWPFRIRLLPDPVHMLANAYLMRCILNK